MAGANLKTFGRHRALKLFWKYLVNRNPGVAGVGLRFRSRPRRARYPTFLYKEGVPVFNTAADAPDKAGQICIDITNENVYLSSSMINEFNHLWLKISD